MVWIETGVLFGWQEPGNLRNGAESLQRSVSSYASRVSEAQGMWSRFPSAYEGAAQEELYGALDLVVGQTDMAVESAGRTVQVIEELVVQLEDIHRRRDSLLNEVQTFNALHGSTPLADLGALENSRRQRLVGDIEFASTFYKHAMQKYADALRSIVIDSVPERPRRIVAQAGVGIGVGALSSLSYATTESRFIPADGTPGQRIAPQLTGRTEVFGSPLKSYRADQSAKWADGMAQLKKNPLTLGHQNASLLGKQFVQGLVAGVPGVGMVQSFAHLSSESLGKPKPVPGEAGQMISATTRSHWGTALGKAGGSAGTIVFWSAGV